MEILQGLDITKKTLIDGNQSQNDLHKIFKLLDGFKIYLEMGKEEPQEKLAVPSKGDHLPKIDQAHTSTFIKKNQLGSSQKFNR